MKIFQKIRKILNLMAHSNLIISLGSTSLTYLTVSLLSLYSDFKIFIIPFFVSFFVYTFNRFTDIKEDNINIPERANFIKYWKNEFFVLSLISLLLALILSYINSFLTFIIILIPAFFVIIYSYKFTRLKRKFLVKNIIVSLGWSFIPIFVGAYLRYFSIELLIIAAYIFSRIFIGVIMFDIRDITGDKINKIDTIPIKLGIKNSKKIINIFNIFSFLIFIVSIITLSFPIKSIIPAITGFVFGLFYINVIEKDIDKKFLCDVIVDGEYICLGLVLMIYDVLI